MRTHIFLGTLLFAAVLTFTACEKSFDVIPTQKSDFSNDALVQVFVPMMNANRNVLSVDGQKQSAGLITTGTLFPAIVNSVSLYTSIPAGQPNFLMRDTLATTTQVPLNFSANLEGGKKYMLFVYDTITSPKQKIVETTIQNSQPGSCRMRFANFVYNPTPIPAVNVFSSSRNANIFTNVNVGDVTSFIDYPVIAANDTLFVRPVGSTTNLTSLTFVGGFPANFNYTYVFRGSFRNVTGRASTLITSF
jgi:hypothetical protein